jgi:predicted transcriptional regulator
MWFADSHNKKLLEKLYSAGVVLKKDQKKKKEYWTEKHFV